MWLIFLIIGLSLLYLSRMREVAKKIYLQFLILKNKKIVLMDKRLSFKKTGDNRFFVCIPKDSPKNLYENIKIYYAIQFLFFKKKINTDLLDENPIKIILKYNDKELFFYFDKNLYDDLVKMLDQVCQIQDKLKDDQDMIFFGR